MLGRRAGALLRLWRGRGGQLFTSSRGAVNGALCTIAADFCQRMGIDRSTRVALIADVGGADLPTCAALMAELRRRRRVRGADGVCVALIRPLWKRSRIIAAALTAGQTTRTP